MKTIAEYCSLFNLDSSETVAYNNPLFPAYVRYGILSTYPDYSAVSHWHEDLEFILIKTGKMTYNVNGQLIEVCENDGIMVNSRQLHYGFSAEHNECEFICILLSPKLLQANEWFYQNYIERVTENSSYPYLYLAHDGWEAVILEKLDKMYQSFCKYAEEDVVCSEGGEAYFEVMEDFIFIMKVLYGHLDLEARPVKKESSELASLRRMVTYIEEHFMERVTLERIAAAGACCKSKCALLFKKYLRDTPITYTTKLRLRKSLAALLDSDKSITEIAYEYGFGGASYYGETFQKYYGTSPLKYRKMMVPRSA